MARPTPRPTPSRPTLSRFAPLVFRTLVVPTLALLTVLALGLVALAPAAVAATYEERIERTVPLDAGGNVAVHNVNGSIRVTAWDRDEVSIEAVKKVQAGSRSKGEEGLDRIEVDVRFDAGSVTIETRHQRDSGGFFGWLTGNSSKGSVSYELRVPRRADVQARSTNGKVIVAGVAGRVEARTTNGGIEVADVSGWVGASSTNGGIDLSLSAWNGENIEVSTTNGSVRLAIPEDSTGRVTASTVNGSIRLENLDGEDRDRSRRHMDAAINGGGSQRIDLSTVNGSITVVGT